MKRANKLPLQIIDLLGGGTVGACVLGAVWLTAIHNNHSAVEVKELTEAIIRARQEGKALRAAHDRQRTILDSRRAELAESGQLPAYPPVEEYFQILSTIASKHGLRVVRHNPLMPRQYPGLLEQRYAYEVTGSFPHLLQFLQEIESTGYWADVSYLKVERGIGSEEAVAERRVALLTISLFAASPGEASSEEGGA